MENTNGVVAPKRTIIRFTQEIKNSKNSPWVQRPIWVQSIAFVDGPGYKVKRVSFTSDREKAAQLSSTAAVAVAEQYFNRVIVLEFADGTPNVEATAQLLRQQMVKLGAHNENVRRANQQMKSFWAEMVLAVPELAKIAVMVAR